MRENQKQRTRADLLRAAAAFMDRGEGFTLPQAADAAGVSRATAYRYFSRSEDLLQEALLDRAAQSVAPKAAASVDTAEDQVDDLVGQVMALVLSNEAAFRTFLAASASGGEQKRGGRRLAWLDETLSPLAAALSAEAYATLRDALAVLLGIEAVVVLKDVCALKDKRVASTTRWAARALVRSALHADC